LGDIGPKNLNPELSLRKNLKPAHSVTQMPANWIYPTAPVLARNSICFCLTILPKGWSYSFTAVIGGSWIKACGPTSPEALSLMGSLWPCPAIRSPLPSAYQKFPPLTDASPLSSATLERIKLCVPISGLFDLRPLLKLTMNEDWKLDLRAAIAESPVFQLPHPHIKISAWVGGGELPEFLRHTDLLANIWTGCGADITAHKAGDRHHFNVIDGLRSKDDPLTQAVCLPR